MKPTLSASISAIALVTWLLGARSAPAQSAYAPEPRDTDESSDREVLQRTENRVNARVGVASSDGNGRPVICLEVRAVARLSVEGCGTGSGFLHHAPGAELAHFRAKWAVHRRVVKRGVGQLQLGLGMAELQLGPDEPGFVVRPESGGIEAVGPEVSLAVQWLRPMGGGWELMVNAGAGVAWVPGAGSLSEARDAVQPFLAFEVGAGW